MLDNINKIIVAIHGVGSQQRGETVRRVTSQFGLRSESTLAVMPLGFFYLERVGEIRISVLQNLPPASPLDKIGFVEVFWADIPKKVDAEKDTIEEMKAWGKSVASRAHALYSTKVLDRAVTDKDFKLAYSVIEEIVESIDVMENLLFIAGKMGIFKFDLAPLLREYVGDVQLVADFKYFRDRITFRFHKAMHDILQRLEKNNPEIYIVAHSEGTVVSLLALLDALSISTNGTICDPEDPLNQEKFISTNWIDYVHGYMTIGSPIDKHLILWPDLWKKMVPSIRPIQRKIRWRNYYDYGDPIGFKLDTAAKYLKDNNCQAFDFTSTSGKDDFGFSRYWFPGKAHNDYWSDSDVFGHFIESVVLPKNNSAVEIPKGKRGVGILSTAIPYVLSFALHFLAIYMLLKSIQPAIKYFVRHVEPSDFYATLVSLLALTVGVTVTARVPRLTRRIWKWQIFTWIFFAGAAAFYLKWAPGPWICLIGDIAIAPSQCANLESLNSKLKLLAFAAGLTVIAGYILPRTLKISKRFIIGLSATALGATALKITLATDAQFQLWPFILGSCAFLYLWWLGMLVFDLSFIWTRYVRHSVAIETLRSWDSGHNTEAKKIFGKSV